MAHWTSVNSTGPTNTWLAHSQSVKNRRIWILKALLIFISNSWLHLVFLFLKHPSQHQISNVPKNSRICQIFSSPEPKARVSYCHSAPSVVRPCGVNFSHFRLLLIRPVADPGRGKNRSRGVPFFKKLLLQTGRLQRQTKWIAMI